MFGHPAPGFAESEEQSKEKTTEGIGDEDPDRKSGRVTAHLVAPGGEAPTAQSSETSAESQDQDRFHRCEGMPFSS